MGRFLTARAAVSELEQVIKTSKKELVLLSPFVKLSTDVAAWLRDADSRGVRTTLVFGKREMDESEMDKLVSFRKLRLLYSERLHAKCYFSESRMIITSLNLFETSEKNEEFGIALSSDELTYREASEEAHRIIAAAEPRRLLGARIAAVVKRFGQHPAEGFCIRCATAIPLDPERPHCDDCYGVWARFSNWDFQEKFCHRCKTLLGTTRAKPLCTSCYRAAAARH